MTELLYRRLLVKAADRLGTTAQLADALDVSNKQLSAWLTGAAPVPPAVLHKVVDLLAAQSPSAPHRVHGARARANSELEETLPH